MAWYNITKINTQHGSNYVAAWFNALTTSAQSLTTGNFVVVGVRFYVPETEYIVNSVTDTAGNTYVKAIGRKTAYDSCRNELWYTYNATGNASNVITANISGNVQYWGVVAVQYSGILTTDPLDVTAIGDTASGTLVTSAAFTTTREGQLIVAITEHDNTVGQTWTAGSGYTIQVQDAGNVVTLEDKIVVPIQTNIIASMTLGVTRNLSINVATFKGIPKGGSFFEIL